MPMKLIEVLQEYAKKYNLSSPQCVLYRANKKRYWWAYT